LRKPIVLVGVAAVIALAGLELFLRATGFSSPVWYQSDPVLGWTLRPGASGWYNREGRALVQVNSAGQRDREHALQKPAGVYRIAVLGDAYAEAMQVPMESTYWAQLPGLLGSCGFQQGKRIEVLNFGVRDYGTAQIYLTLERTAIRYAPDLVLLQFDHDVRDNSPALDPIRDRPAAGAQHLVECAVHVALSPSLRGESVQRRQSARRDARKPADASLEPGGEPL